MRNILYILLILSLGSCALSRREKANKAVKELKEKYPEAIVTETLPDSADAETPAVKEEIVLEGLDLSNEDSTQKQISVVQKGKGKKKKKGPSKTTGTTKGGYTINLEKQKDGKIKATVTKPAETKKVPVKKTRETITEIKDPNPIKTAFDKVKEDGWKWFIGLLLLLFVIAMLVKAWKK